MQTHRKHTLVIHPADPTTTFLEACYAQVKDATIVRGPVSREELTSLFERPDQRIMLLGHGLPHGLLNVRGFIPGRWGIAVGDDYQDRLAGNRENIMIFCYAHTFGTRIGISGFRSDMFISEVAEASHMGIYQVSQEEVDFSNRLFAGLVGEKINECAREIHRHVTSHYGKAAGSSQVIRYNHKRLYYAE